MKEAKIVLMFIVLLIISMVLVALPSLLFWWFNAELTVGVIWASVIGGLVMLMGFLQTPLVKNFNNWNENK